jgi:hypothetical protein
MYQFNNTHLAETFRLNRSVFMKHTYRFCVLSVLEEIVGSESVNAEWLLLATDLIMWIFQLAVHSQMPV